MKLKRKFYILLILVLSFVFTTKDSAFISPVNADIPPPSDSGGASGGASHDTDGAPSSAVDSAVDSAADSAASADSGASG
jgi:hypothetical protein